MTIKPTRQSAVKSKCAESQGAPKAGTVLRLLYFEHHYTVESTVRNLLLVSVGLNA